jgi:hypothetical protein
MHKEALLDLVLDQIILWTVVLCTLLAPLALGLTLAYFPFLVIGIAVAWVVISCAGCKTK